MNCVIDKGNTKTKVYLFGKNNELLETHRFFNEEEEALILLLQKLEFNKGIISSSASISNILNKATAHFLKMHTSLKLPIRLNYKTPATLGTDRIALCVGANLLFPAKNCLIISLGTCITADVVSKKAVYEGGLISPGLHMRFQALHQFTDKLPLINVKNDADIPLEGKSTQESIESGVYNGMRNEIEGIIKQFNTNYEDLTLLISGGDMKIFELNIKNKIFAERNLQAIGLNRILNYNA